MKGDPCCEERGGKIRNKFLPLSENREEEEQGLWQGVRLQKERHVFILSLADMISVKPGDISAYVTACQLFKNNAAWQVILHLGLPETVYLCFSSYEGNQ